MIIKSRVQVSSNCLGSSPSDKCILPRFLTMYSASEHLFREACILQIPIIVLVDSNINVIFFVKTIFCKNKTCAASLQVEGEHSCGRRGGGQQSNAGCLAQTPR